MIYLFKYHNIKKAQSDVDFLIPFLDTDRRYCCDPSLLRFTKTKSLIPWNEEVQDFLKLIQYVIKKGDSKKLKKVLNIGEAPDAGLGYCKEGVTGSGFGKEISHRVIDILTKNKIFLERGFIRLEELQWMDYNIGPDRISDLVINILKKHIVKYTQQQAKKNRVPMEKVRVNKVFEPNSLEWVSIITHMPINPKRIVRDAINPHPPLLFLPKEVVKTLPLFLSYDNFYGFIDPKYKPSDNIRKSKYEIIEVAIKDPKISEDFIKQKETRIDKLYRPDFNSGIQRQIAILDKIPIGDKKYAEKYLDTVKEIIDFVFDDIIFYKKEKSTILGENRRDLIYQNNATSGIFFTFKNKHLSTHIVIDAKNTNDITSKDVAQIANYLNDDIGRVAFLISRKKDTKLRKHAYAELTKQKKVILFIADEDLKRWVTEKTRIQHVTGNKLQIVDPLKSIENMYSDLMCD